MVALVTQKILVADLSNVQNQFRLVAFVMNSLLILKTEFEVTISYSSIALVTGLMALMC